MSFLFGDSGLWAGSVEIDSASTKVAIDTKNAATAVFEVTADSTFTATIEACLDQTDSVWREVPCLVSDGGAYVRKEAGSVLSLTTGDLVIVPSVGYLQIRLKRAGGTATVRPASHPADAASVMLLTTLPEFGNAGTPSADVSTVQGIAGMVPVVTKPKLREVQFTLSLDTAAYAAGDLLADSQLLAGVVSANNAFGKVVGVQLIDKDDQDAGGIDLLLLSANVSLGTENATPSISDANAANICGVIRVLTGDWIDLGGCKIAYGTGSVPVTPVLGSDDIYVAAITQSARTHSASGITGRIWIEEAE